MQARLMLVIALLLPLAVYAQPPRATPAKGTVNGSVVNASNNQPLRKATVTLTSTAQSTDQDPRAYTATSEDDGRFSIEGIEPGRYSVFVQRNGYLLDRRARKLRMLRVDAGQKIPDLLLPMQPAGILTGRVVDKDGDPLPKATIWVMQKRGGAAASRLSHRDRAETNDMGEYRIFQLHPGNYYVVASVEREFAMMQGTKLESGPTYVPLYYPGTVDRAQAVPVEIRPDSEARADFTMLPAQTFHVRGKVIVGPEAPLHTVLMLRSLDDEAAEGNFMAFAKEDRTFDISGVPSGSYKVIAVTVSLETQERQVAQAKVEVQDANVEGVIVRLAGGKFKIHGRITADPKPGFDVSQLTVMLQPSDPDGSPEAFSTMGFGGGEGFTKVKRDGTFVLEGVMPGRYFPEIFSASSGAREYYVKSVRYGMKDISDAELVLGESSSTLPLEIVVSSGGQLIEGTVLNADSKPVAGATVVALPDAKRRKRLGSYESSMTDQDGRYMLQGIRPGDYTLLAFDEPEEYFDFDPESLMQFESKGVAFRARAGARERITLKLTADEVP